MTTLRTIDFTQKHFECDGRKFYVRESLSFARYRELQKINLEFGFSATFHDIFKNVRQAWDFLNATKLGEAAVVLHNIMYGVVSLDDKDDPALRLCALFIDEEGEDATIYDEGKMREKIECWSKSLDVTPFFQLAASLTPHWTNAYRIIIPSSSEETPETTESKQ
jgi:hypothetical protein